MSNMFNSLGNGLPQQQGQNQPGNMSQDFQMFQQFAGNPMQFLSRAKLNIPQNLQNNPQAMIQHLLDSGQMSQQQYAQVQKMASMLQQNPMFMRLMRGR